jgi:hypothetical protein
MYFDTLPTCSVPSTQYWNYNEAWAKLEKNSALQRAVAVLILIWEGEFFIYSMSHNKVGKLRPLDDSEINQHLSHS